jgi:hypothetical protein
LELCRHHTYPAAALCLAALGVAGSGLKVRPCATVGLIRFEPEPCRSGVGPGRDAGVSAESPGRRGRKTAVLCRDDPGRGGGGLAALAPDRQPSMGVCAGLAGRRPRPRVIRKKIRNRVARFRSRWSLVSRHSESVPGGAGRGERGASAQCRLLSCSILITLTLASDLRKWSDIL